MAEFRMPSLGADMDVGTIIEWLVKPGDPVKRGQIVAVVDTAKAAIEIEAFQDGVFQEILVKPGVQVPVGTPLAIIGAPGEAPAAAPAAGPAAESRPEAAPVTVSPVPEAPARAVAAVPPLARIDHAAPEGVRYALFSGLSDNEHHWADIEHAREVVGYIPQDRAEDA